MCSNLTVMTCVNMLWARFLVPFSVDQSSSEMDGVSRRLSRSEVPTRSVLRPGRSSEPSRTSYRDRRVSPPSGGESPVFSLGASPSSTCLRRAPSWNCPFLARLFPILRSSSSLDDLEVLAFPPFFLLSRVVARVHESSRLAMTLLAPL